MLVNSLIMKIEVKFSKHFVNEVKDTIRAKRSLTSSEIFVHVDQQHDEEDDWERAEIVFDALHVEQTALRNAVLLYVSIQDKSLFILGDTGVNETVSEDFFEPAKSTIINYFKLAQFGPGIIAGVNQLAEDLAEVFPALEADIEREPSVTIED